ncbi:MAG: DUF938 domain-containing protein, partial [Paracoccaceae bacterium]
NMASIAAWTAFAGCANVRAPVVLDAARPGWAKGFAGQDVVLVVNLLHLISGAATEAVLAGIAQVLAVGGKALIYGPFLRDGVATSAGDAAFDASLRAQDPTIGYKDLAWVCAQLAKVGLRVRVQEMPANNLMLITFKI